MNKKILKIGIVGLGSVGQGVIKILQDNSELIKRKQTLTFKLLEYVQKIKIRNEISQPINTNGLITPKAWLRISLLMY